MLGPNVRSPKFGDQTLGPSIFGNTETLGPSIHAVANFQTMPMAAWEPFGELAAHTGDARKMQVGTVGAKNLNLRRRMPLSPLNQNTQNRQNDVGGIRGKQQHALTQHSNTALGGKAVLLSKLEDGGWAQGISPSCDVLLSPDTNNADCRAAARASPQEMAANRSRIKKEVTAHPTPRTIASPAFGPSSSCLCSDSQ